MGEEQQRDLFVPPKPHKHKKGTDWTMWAVLAPVALAIVSWAISIEVRMSKEEGNVDSRVTKMESALEQRFSKIDTSMEQRFSKMDSAMDMAQRVKNLEDLMTPLLVDWKVNQELKKLGIARPTPEASPTAVAPSLAPAPPPPVVRPNYTNPKAAYRLDKPVDPEDLKKQAQSWAESQVRQNRPPTVRTEK